MFIKLLLYLSSVKIYASCDHDFTVLAVSGESLVPWNKFSNGKGIQIQLYLIGASLSMFILFFWQNQMLELIGVDITRST